MYEELKRIASYLWQNHRGKSVGVLLGLIISLSVLLFGFWATLFISGCVLVGLYLGIRYDRGDDLFKSLTDSMPHRLHEWDGWR